jgi:hypothetical protein
MVEFLGFSIRRGDPNDGESLADITPDERDRYLAWWAKFKMLDRLNWVGVGLVLLSYFASRRYPSVDWRTVVVSGLVVTLATRIWLRSLTCPRCGATYSGGLITVINRLSFLNKCYGCDLSLRGLRQLEHR